MPDLQNFNNILVIILLIVLIIAIVVLVIQISRTLSTLNLILEDTENLTAKISYLSDHPEEIQRNAERYITQSIDNVVRTQTSKLRSSFANDVIGVIVQQLRR